MKCITFINPIHRHYSLEYPTKYCYDTPKKNSEQNFLCKRLLKTQHVSVTSFYKIFKGHNKVKNTERENSGKECVLFSQQRWS